MQIFIFTWNVQSKLFPDNCKFFQELSKCITPDIDLLIVALQEDDINNSKLIGNLSIYFEKDYDLIRIVSLAGWGSTTFNALIDDWKYCPRGLHMAVFKNKNADFILYNTHIKEFICPGLQNFITWGKGGIIINLETNCGNFCFLNVHLPFMSSSLIPDINNPSKRIFAAEWQAACFSYIYKRTMDSFKNIHYFFMLGDFNFRVQLIDGDDATIIAKKLFTESNDEYLKHLINNADELRILTEYELLPRLNEGIKNNGPVFLPTCKLKKTRTEILNDNIYNTGSEKQRTPSWCDRILINDAPTCIKYDRFDMFEMVASDHAAVYGIYSCKN